MDKDLDKVINDMYDLEEDVDDDIDLTYIDEFEVTDKQMVFAQDIQAFIQGIVDDELLLTEDMTGKNLSYHYNKHSISNKPQRKSKRTNVYYDFTDMNDYRDRVNFVDNYKVHNDNVIDSLLNADKVVSAFYNLFRGGCSIRFSRNCGFVDDHKCSTTIIMHAFANDVTTNYQRENTIDLLINGNRGSITMFPVSASYVETKINQIIKKYNNLPDKPEIKINH